jgi:hypothetical protein
MPAVVESGRQREHEPKAAPTFIVLHSFPGHPTDGGNPYAGLVRDAAGNLCGTTLAGGDTSTCNTAFGFGCGVVFRLALEEDGG